LQSLPHIVVAERGNYLWYIVSPLDNISLSACFYGDLVLAAAIKHTLVFMWSAWYFLSDFNQIWIFSTDLH